MAFQGVFKDVQDVGSNVLVNHEEQGWCFQRSLRSLTLPQIQEFWNSLESVTSVFRSLTPEFIKQVQRFNGGTVLEITGEVR